MANARVVITFNDDPQLNEYVCFRAFTPNANPPLQAFFHMQYVNIRTGAGQISINQILIPDPESPQPAAGVISATMFALFWEQDFNAGGVYTVTRNENVVTIEAPNALLNFDRTNEQHGLAANVDMEFFLPDGGGGNETPFYITNVEYKAATDNPVCTHYRVRITCSDVIDTLTIIQLGGNIEVDGNGEVWAEFERLRGQKFRISVENENGVADLLQRNSGQVPNAWNEQSVQYTINQNPISNTVTVNGVMLVNTENQLTFEYALDNVEELTSNNLFNNVSAGEHTLYVSDSIGCVKSLVFTLTETNITKPYYYFSESLPFRFCARLDFDNCTAFQGIRHRLSHEERAEDETLVYTWFTPWKNCDNQTLQFRSAFENNRVFVVLPDGTEEELVVNRITNLIGVKDKRDARKISLADNKTGVYFTSGQTYDFDTSIPNGVHNLNGGLPEWARIGNYINLDGNWAQITNVIYDDELEAEVIVIDAIYTGAEVAAIAGSIFNRQPFNVYEFAFIGAQYSDSMVRIRVELSDPNFTTVDVLTEIIDVAEEHHGTVCIDYWNSKNSDLVYKGGRKFRVRMPLLRTTEGTEGEQDPLKTDDSVTLQSADLYDTLEFNFDSTPKGVTRQLSKILAHEFVFIDGDGFAKNAEVEYTPQEKSNLMLLKQLMISTNAPYNTEPNGAEVEVIDNENVFEVPNIIAPDDDSFIGY